MLLFLHVRVASKSRGISQHGNEKQEERKKRFFVEDNLENLLEKSQSIATKRNTKWVVKLF